MKELRKIVSGFTAGLLGKSATTSKCFLVCWPLSGYLHMLGYEAYLTEGELHFSEKDIEHHYWIEFPDGTIADPTADQFNNPDRPKMPRNFVGKKPDWYKTIDSPSKKKRAS